MTGAHGVPSVDCSEDFLLVIARAEGVRSPSPLLLHPVSRRMLSESARIHRSCRCDALLGSCSATPLLPFSVGERGSRRQRLVLLKVA
jgi:hypothetical protein